MLLMQPVSLSYKYHRHIMRSATSSAFYNTKLLALDFWLSNWNLAIQKIVSSWFFLEQNWGFCLLKLIYGFYSETSLQLMGYKQAKANTRVAKLTKDAAIWNLQQRVRWAAIDTQQAARAHLFSQQKRPQGKVAFTQWVISERRADFFSISLALRLISRAHIALSESEWVSDLPMSARFQLGIQIHRQGKICTYS